MGAVAKTIQFPAAAAADIRIQPYNPIRWLTPLFLLELSHIRVFSVLQS